MDRKEKTPYETEYEALVTISFLTQNIWKFKSFHGGTGIVLHRTTLTTFYQRAGCIYEELMDRDIWEEYEKSINEIQDRITKMDVYGDAAFAQLL